MKHWLRRFSILVVQLGVTATICWSCAKKSGLPDLADPTDSSSSAETDVNTDDDPTLTVKGTTDVTYDLAYNESRRFLAFLWDGFAGFDAFAQEAAGLGTPTEFNVNFYALWVSANADCTQAALVSDFGDEPREFDLKENPTLFEGVPAEGEYPCVIIKFSDVMSFKADAIAVANHQGCSDTTTLYTFDVNRADIDVADESYLWKDLDGSPTQVTGTKAEPGADPSFFFISTDPESVTYGEVGASPWQTALLENPLEIPGSGKFKIDIEDQITNTTDDQSDNYCWLDTPIFSFVE